MKRIFRILFPVIFCLTSVLGLAGCQTPTPEEEKPWWKDRENLEIEILCTIPGQERSLERMPLLDEEWRDYGKNTLFTFEVDPAIKKYVRLPFTTVKLYYKGEDVFTDYQRCDCYIKEYPDDRFHEFLQYEHNMIVPEHFYSNYIYHFTWTFFEKCLPNAPESVTQDTRPGINQIKVIGYNVNIQYKTPNV